MATRASNRFRFSIALVAVLGTGAALGQANPALPEPLKDVGLVERLDAPVPLDLDFVDEQGRPVRLGDYFIEGRPVLLSLVYYRCPMLCSLALDGMLDALREVDLEPGDDFELVSVSIDPRETPQLARKKKQNYVKSYGRAGAETGWHFLTGEQPEIQALAATVGFGYRYLEDRDEFAHPAAMFVITPDGRVSRYLTGVNHAPQTVRLSLVEASEGKIGTTVDRFLLYCYQYDATEGAYAPVAMRIMRLGATATAMALGAMLLSFWLRDSRRKKLA